MNRSAPALTLILAACGPLESTRPPRFGDGTPEYDDATRRCGMPSEDFAATVDVGSWNVEWFGATDKGPTDEARSKPT